MLGYHVSMATDDSDIIVKMARLVIKHDGLLNAMAISDGNQAILLERTLERCGCGEAVTVENVFTQRRCCDRCAARAIVAEGGQQDDDAWTDVPHAAQVRWLQDLVSLVLRGDDKQSQVH